MSAYTTEATALAWVCGATIQEAESAYRVLGLRTNSRFFSRLRAMTRIAYHLGTVMEIHRHRAAAVPPPGRALLYLRYDQDFADLWGVEDGCMALQVQTDVSWLESGSDVLISDHIRRCEREGRALRPTSWLIPVGLVHA